ncbi:MAG: HmuY family protein [Bacteroidia bacterium]|nr:HmuY family protein [Bacteroidia bacterium]NNJ54738.1 hypothetical protein [Bacteroidia bacterium]
MNLKSKLVIIISLFFAACFSKEDPIEPKLRLNQSVELDAGESRTEINFYSLERDELVGKANPEDWDLYITPSKIQINYFRSIRVAPFAKEWHNQLDTVGLAFSYLTDKNPNRMWEIDLDSTYVLDMGFDSEFKPMGIIKLKVSKVGSDYKIQYGPIESAFELVETVSGTDFYYHINDKVKADVPTESEYDVAFGKYTEFVVIGEEEADYLVLGALLGSASAIPTTIPFDEITTLDIDTASFNKNKKNAIGWDWKAYSLDKGAYEIDQDKSYLIKTDAGFKYKLRFVNFYNNKGVSGHPTFEYKLL